MKNRVKETIILVLMYVFIIALMLGGTWGVAYLTEKLSGHEPDVMIRSITINAAIFIPLLIFTIVRKDSIKDTFGLHKIKFTTALWAILLSIVCSPMYMLANLLSQLFVPNVVAQNFDSLSSGVNNMGVLLFATVIMAPIFEELVCRGFFFNVSGLSISK